MRFDISAYKVGTPCGPSVIHKLDFDNPKVYGDTSIFDGLGQILDSGDKKFVSLNI